MAETSKHDAHDPRTRSALADTARITGTPCHACGTTLCGHDAVLALVLGYKNAPRCLGCIAAHMAESTHDLRARTFDYVRHHDCFLTAWTRASELEGMTADAAPACLIDRTASPPDLPAAGAPAATAPPEDRWDAGDMGCGDLVLELRLRLKALAPGGVLALRATDPGAPIDLPAWCNLTGHRLVAAEHPEYRIRRK